ncbi:MAG: tRNA (adenosine(37)-N6)-dimethylallyltransferase MiaA, partial [Micrococcales bacterium]|nr:tRNA (adenosine(37)-N6)-dimethylallyltransferase MiaA [Micrococcales bacterium]
PVLAIVGPTASGKSDLALSLAERLGAEIINADASQLYRGMDIGTAKVPLEQRRGIAHHQLDVLDIGAEASVAAYQRQARADLRVIQGRGRQAILVGGSGLYVRAALDELDIPPRDAAVRVRLEAQLAERGIEALREKLRALDPRAHERIEARNGRRIVRALEVIELTGRPFSATLPTGRFAVPTVLIALRVPREQLDARIERRTRAMWAQGFLHEVEGLAARGLAETRTASRAVGYPQAQAQLAGECTQAEAIAATAAATRRLVRRQESWWRSDTRVAWIEAADGSNEQDLAGRTLDLLRAGDDGSAE